MAATDDAEVPVADRDPESSEVGSVFYVTPMTLWGVPLVDVFTEWHRRWVADPAAYAAEVEALGMQDASYGEEAVAYLVALAEEMSDF